MRHVLLPRAPTTGPRRMRQATATAGLVAPTGGTLGVRAGLLCTAAGAIDLTVVAAAANQHLHLTADTHEQPGRRWLAVTWTTSALPEIMPRHACLARCGARRRSGLGGLGRRRACHPAGGHRAIVRAIQRATSATHADLWICGTTQERCPTYPQGQKTKSKCLFDCLESGGSHIQPVGSHTRPVTATTRHQTAAPSLRGFRQPFTLRPLRSRRGACS